MRRRLRIFREGKFFLLTAVVILGVVRLALFCLPYRSVVGYVKRGLKKAHLDLAGIDAYQRQIVWAVKAIARRMPGDKPCLPQALAVQWLLSRKGKSTELHIGVRKDAAGELAAHAWLEDERGIVIGGDGSPMHFERLQMIKS